MSKHKLRRKLKGLFGRNDSQAAAQNAQSTSNDGTNRGNTEGANAAFSSFPPTLENSAHTANLPALRDMPAMQSTAIEGNRIEIVTETAVIAEIQSSSIPATGEEYPTQESAMIPSTRGDSAAPANMPPPGGSRGQNGLEFAATATKFAMAAIVDVADALPVLKSVAAGLKLILEHASTAVSNRSYATDVLARVDRLLKSLEIPLDDAEENARRKQLREKLAIICEQLNRVVKSKGFLNRLQQFMAAPDNAEDIKKYVGEVDIALREYELSLQQGIYYLNAAQKSLLQDLLTFAAKRTHDDEDTALRQMPRADDAGFESTDDRSRCLEGTRVELLEALRIWTDDVSSPQVFWLSGHAGSGKTTIAQTFAEDLGLAFRLGASFFCSRDSQGRSDLKMIFVTLAFQLARGKDAASSLYRTALLRALKDHPNVGSLSLRNQFEYFIIGPAQESGLATVVVIDALDECRDNKPTSTILDLLASIVGRIPKIKFFITSRPEPHIREGFRLPQLKPITEVLQLHEVTTVHVDIKKYLRKSLTEIAARRSQPCLPEGWPMEGELEALTEKSEGLFIHASTVVKILSRRKVDPQVKLRQLLDNVGDYTHEGKTGLNTLYLGILRAALQLDEDEDEDDAKNIENILRAVLGFLVVARSAVAAATVADIVLGQSIEESRVLLALRSLHSLVLVPDDRTRPIRFHHKSFPDFLTDPSRCTDPRFHINRDDHEFYTAMYCFAVMQRKLKRNICGMERYAMNDSLDMSVRDSCIDESLRYSCRYWANHMLSDSCRVVHFKDICEPLERWLETRLLQWLEVLELLRELGEAVKALTGVREWLALCGVEYHTLLEYVTDGHRFTLSYFDVIQASVAHIYHSALLFVPKTPFWKMYIGRERGNKARLIQGHEQHWSSLMRTVQVPNWALTVKYSHDGSILAVGGRGFSQLFHSATGERLAELEADCGWVKSASFSCNDRTLATASGSSIRLWEISTGSCISRLDVDDMEFYSVEFHPHMEHVLVAGNRIGRIYIWDVRDPSHQTAFQVEESYGYLCWLRRSGPQYVFVGCNNGDTEMWDVGSSQQVRVFSPPPSKDPSVWAVASSHDGSMVASGSYGGVLVVYSTDTGDVVHSFQSDREIFSVAFSPTQPIIVVGSASHSVHIFHLDCNRMISLDGHRDWVRSVAFSPDGRFLASASDDRTINVWETNAVDSALHDEHHSQWVNSAHFSHNGEFVISASDDKTVKMWDSRTGALYATLDGHRANVRDAVILSDGVHVVSVDNNGTLTLWDWQQAKLLCTDTISTGYYRSRVFPYSHHAHPLGFISIHYHRSDNIDTVCCWAVEPLHIDGPRMVLIARGALDTSSVIRINHRGSLENKDLTLVAECYSGKQFLATWNNPAVVSEQPQELHFVEDTGQPPVKDAPRSLFAWEMPSRQSEDKAWILNEHDERIMWVPLVNRGPSLWYGRKLLIAGESGRLTLVDFSNENENRDSF